MADAIIMEQVRKTFGEKVAVEGLDLAVKEGGLYGFIGPNGAGKTTSIRMIMSIIFPDSGRLSVLGKPSAIESKDRIGYLPEERGVYKKMKVGAFIEYVAKLKGVHGGPQLRKTVADWLERVGLEKEINKKCEELSKGMQQKVQFISCVLPEPDLLILDEPFSGLDPVNMRLMRDLFLEQHAQGRTLIFSTHVMFQAEQLCRHIVMIDRGRKVLDAPMHEIRGPHMASGIAFVPAKSVGADEAQARAGSVEGVTSVRITEQGFEADLEDNADAGGVLGAIASALPVQKIELRTPSLEDIFVDIVGRGDEQRSEDELRAELAGAGQGGAL